jgi:hypothetical protein
MEEETFVWQDRARSCGCGSIGYNLPWRLDRGIA